MDLTRRRGCLRTRQALTGAEIERDGFSDPLSFDMATAIVLDL